MPDPIKIQILPAAPTAWNYIHDIATLVIALTSTSVAVLVYRYQQRQNRAASEQNARQAARNTRLEWVRLLIVEPNRDYILEFFRLLERTLTRTNHSPFHLEQRREVTSELDTHFNEFNRRFLTYFDNNSLLAQNSPHRELIEKLQDSLNIGIDEFSDAEHIASHRKLVQHVVVCRNQFLSALYSLSLQEPLVPAAAKK